MMADPGGCEPRDPFAWTSFGASHGALFSRGVRHGVIKMPSICIRIVKFALKDGAQIG